MEAIAALWDGFKTFIIREFLWFFLTLFLAMLLTLTSLWLLNEFSISLRERLDWQGVEDNSLYLILMATWFVIIYLIRLVRGAILFLVLPKTQETDEVKD
ncbi:MAG: hypothetical protein AAF617_01600 [Bacteroidota bacterium]